MNNLTVNLENLTSKEREQLTKLIEKSNKPEMIKCTGGSFFVAGNAKVYKCSSSQITKKLGLEYETEEEAQKENKALTELRILNNIIRQENKRTGFVADWNDNRQVKYRFNFNHTANSFFASSKRLTEVLAQEACNKDSSARIIEWLDKGLIEGITRGKKHE